MDPIDELFDFAAFDSNEQNISEVAAYHLFNNGPDLFGLEPSDIIGNSTDLPFSGNLIDSFANDTSGTVSLPLSDRDFFVATFDLFTDVDFGTEQTTLAQPIDQPAPQFMAHQFDGGHELAFEPITPAVPEIPALTIDPAVLLDEDPSYPHTALATREEQHWQDFESQQTQFCQPEIHIVQGQQMQADPQWPVMEDQLGLNLESPFESPVNEPVSQDVQASPDPLSPQNLQQVGASPQRQEILSGEQIQLLQNARSGEHAQPSIEVSPTTTPSSSHDEENTHTTSRFLNALTSRSDRSSRTTTPEQGTRGQPLPRTPLQGLTFVSLQDAEAAMPSRHIESNWKPPSPDNTIPKTHEKRAEYVLQMFNAFQDTSQCKDNTNGFSYVKRWQTRDYYNLQSMEKVCWHMLNVAERLHNQGPSSTNIFCEEALKKLKASRNLTFEQRIHAICAMLRFSKFTCDQLMKCDGLEALVGAPKQKMSGATTMHVQNKKRQKWIVHGRTEDPLHRNPGENGNNGQDSIESTDSAHRKTKQKAQRATPAAKPRANAKARSRTISRDESDDDDESFHRRQSQHGIVGTVDESDFEMADKEQQFITPEPLSLPAPRTPPTPPRRIPVHTSPASPVASLVASPASKESLPSPPAMSPAASDSLDPSSAHASPVSPKLVRKCTPRKRAPSPQVRIPRAALVRQAKRPSPDDDEDSDDFDDRDANGNDESDQHSDEAESDSDAGNGRYADEEDKDTGTEEDEPEQSEIASATPFPSPIRNRKIENGLKKGKTTSTHPLGMLVNRSIKPASKKSNERKTRDEESEHGDNSTHPSSPPDRKPIAHAELAAKAKKRKSHDDESAEEQAPPTKRTKGDLRFTRKSATLASTKQTPAQKGRKSEPLRNDQGRFVRRESTPESEPATHAASGCPTRATRRAAAEFIERRDADKAETSRWKRRRTDRK